MYKIKKVCKKNSRNVPKLKKKISETIYTPYASKNT